MQHQNQHHDLFPETLLVNSEGSRIYTTSLKVADHFHKRHDNVLREIEKLLNALKIEVIEDFNGRNFAPAEYKDSRGRSKPMYELSHDGFALLAMGFTGREALKWKIEFLNAFRTQEHLLSQKTTRYANALDIIRPSLRPVVEGTEQGFNRKAIATPLGKSPNSITYHRRKAKTLGLLP